jgi:hypothetical protein
MEGTGEAQVFGRSGNPMQAYMNRQANFERQAAIKAAIEKAEKEKRDKKTWEMMNVDPEAAWEPFNQQVMDATQKHRARVASDLASRPYLMDDPAWQAGVQKGWDEVNGLARRSQYIKKEIEGARAYIDKNPYLRSEYYHPKFNDLYLNPDGTAKNLNDIDPNAIRDLYINDPNGFNFDKYEKDFKDGLGDNMTNFVTRKRTAQGLETNDVQSTWKGNIYTRDKNSPSGVAQDAEGNAIINPDPMLRSSFLDSDQAKRAYTARAQQLGVPVEDLVNNVFRNAGSLKTDIKPQTKQQPYMPQWLYEQQYGSGLKPDEVNVSKRVFDNINSMVNAFYDPEGNRVEVANPDARAAAGHLEGTKFGNGTIQKAEFVPGSNKPGQSPNDRLLLTVKSGTAGKISKEEVDLTGEGASQELWNYFKNTGRMGKRDIDYDKAVDKLGLDPVNFYKGREYQGEYQKQEKAVIDALGQGQGGESLQGKSFNGTPIKSVVPRTERTLWHPIDGEFKGYDITLDNGQKAFVPADDVDAFQNILRSKSKIKTAGKKKTGVTWD